MDTINLGGIVPESVVDGPGIRLVFFAQGCRHNCPGCFNFDLQPFDMGQARTVDELETIFCENIHVNGVTFSGGDPFEQAEPFSKLARLIRGYRKSIWAYSGYRIEDLLACKIKTKLLSEIDVLVDGPFLQEEKDLSLLFKGSANQRIIDVPKTLQTGVVHLWQP